MKRARFWGAVLALIFLLSACGKPQTSGNPEASATPAPGETPGISSGTSGDAAGDGEPGGEDAGQGDQSAEGKNNRLYDPSIYVIEASGTWRHEIAEGYYVDYECELYLDKVDANDNRSSGGTYTGFFWLGVDLDAGDFISDMLGDVPVDMSFAAGGEGICDNFTVYLTTRDIWERDQYAIPLAIGGEQAAGEHVLLDKGSFIAVGKQAYLEAIATGVQGEGVEHRDAQVGDVELSYIIHMQPDAFENGTERAVTIFLTDNQGMTATIFGTMRRLPGYPEDVSRYAQDAPYQQKLNEHLE